MRGGVPRRSIADNQLDTPPLELVDRFFDGRSLLNTIRKLWVRHATDPHAGGSLGQFRFEDVRHTEVVDELHRTTPGARRDA